MANFVPNPALVRDNPNLQDKSPLVLIVTPTVPNRPLPILKRCIGGVDNQTYKNWKHIVCSDGVTSSTNLKEMLQVVLSPKRSYEDLTNPLGHYGAGIRQYIINTSSEGVDYICFLDDDNIIFPNYLKVMVDTLEYNQDAQFAICQIVHCGPLNEEKFPLPCPQIITGIPPVCQNIDTLQVMVRKKAMLECGWVLDGYLSDGKTYEKLGNMFPWIAVNEVLGVHC
jgi:glycosyltransferase involved in cell wall biosynthesis